MASPTKRSSKWRRIGKWTFWIANILCLIIAIPLIKAAWPLLEVWWTTRSDSAVASNATFHTNQSIPSLANSEIAALQSLSDQIPHIERQEIDRMLPAIAARFGSPEPPAADPETFDENSAVFDDINKAIREINGVRQHIYTLEMKDRNGNRATWHDAFEKPNADYERSMQTIKLVRKNPQLKHIYDAFSLFLAGKANQQKEPAEDENLEADLETTSPANRSY